MRGAFFSSLGCLGTLITSVFIITSASYLLTFTMHLITMPHMHVPNNILEAWQYGLDLV